jgi:hypothetical protein
LKNENEREGDREREREREREKSWNSPTIAVFVLVKKLTDFC